ncbi:MAG: hypothetical protein R3D55_25565 [Chloroflexota bacterium]
MESVTKASVAAGADGVILEVHPRPEEAMSDGRQSLKPERFAQLVRDMKKRSPRRWAGRAGRRKGFGLIFGHREQ